MGLHSHTLYDELLKIPLIVKFPGNSYSGTIVRKQTRGIDVFPTIIDILGIPAPYTLHGTSLTPFISGSEINMILPAFSEMESGSFTYGFKKSLRLKNHKFIFIKPKKNLSTYFEKMLTKMFFFKLGSDFSNSELYNFINDPMENKNIFGHRRALSETYKAEIQKLINENLVISNSLKHEKIKRGKKVQDQLESLGYLK